MFEARCAFQAGDDGKECTVLTVGRTEILQSSVGLGPKLLAECRYKVRLPQSRFGRDLDHACFAILCRPPVTFEQFNFCLASDKRRRTGVKRLEPAFGCAGPQHGPGPYQL